MKTPWHLWVIGIVSLLWNAGGAFDYVMTRTGNEDYLAQMPPEAVAYFESFPFWVSLFWALGVWGAIAGSFLLMFRSRFAVPAFVISFIGMIGNLIWGMILSPTPMSDLMGPPAAWFSAAIVVVAVFLIWYSMRMKAASVLR